MWAITYQSLIKDKLGISENIAIKKKGDSKNSGDPIAIVCWFPSCKDKTNILKNAKKQKDKNIFINEDFSHESMELHKELWETLKKHMDEGKIAQLHCRTVVVNQRNDPGLS